MPAVQASVLVQAQEQVKGKVVIPAMWVARANDSRARLADEEVIT